MKSRSEFLQEIVRKYRAAGHSWPASPRDIARWAIENKQWAPKPEAIVSQCAEQISQAMSVEYFTDDQGRRVRANHAVVFPEGAKQHVIWDDIRTGDHNNIAISLQQRRKHVVDQCKQLKNDTDYYNEYRNPPRPIQMIFDFTLDMEEWELSRRKRAA
jgi:hypothetical protein